MYDDDDEIIEVAGGGGGAFFNVMDNYDVIVNGSSIWTFDETGTYIEATGTFSSNKIGDDTIIYILYHQGVDGDGNTLQINDSSVGEYVKRFSMNRANITSGPMSTSIDSGDLSIELTMGFIASSYDPLTADFNNLPTLENTGSYRRYVEMRSVSIEAGNEGGQDYSIKHEYTNQASYDFPVHVNDHKQASYGMWFKLEFEQNSWANSDPAMLYQFGKNFWYLYDGN